MELSRPADRKSAIQQIKNLHYTSVARSSKGTVMILMAINKSKRLFYLSFIEHVTAQEIRDNANELEILLREFSSGFRLLADLERLESMDDDCAPEVGKTMDTLKERGLEMVVRIIPDPQRDIGLKILSTVHYGRQVHTHNCSNMMEAVKLLKL